MQVDWVGGGGFDVVMSQFGVMFFDEPVVAFANIARHMRSGGRLGFACWQAMERNPWFVGPVLAPFVAPPPPLAIGKSPTGPFALADPDRVRQVLHDAGFARIKIDPYAHEVNIPLSAAVNDAQLTFMGVNAQAMDDARQAVMSLMGRFATDEGPTDSHWRSRSSPPAHSGPRAATNRPRVHGRGEPGKIRPTPTKENRNVEPVPEGWSITYADSPSGSPGGKPETPERRSSETPTAIW